MTKIISYRLNNRFFLKAGHLFLKEFLITPYQIILILLTPAAITIAVYLFSISYFNSFDNRDCIFIITRMGILMPLLLAEFFLIRKLKKKNFIFIRTLPISDKFIYGYKVSFSFLVLIVAEIPNLLFLYLHFESNPLLSHTTTVLFLLLFVTALTLYISLVFGTKVAFISIGVVAEILIYLWRTFEDSYPGEAARIIESQSLFILASIVLLVGTYIFYRLGVSYFEKRDTRELVA